LRVLAAVEQLVAAMLAVVALVGLEPERLFR
jgi:hypothetical protein